MTVCFTYFRSLTLANLGAALYALSRQDLSRVDSIIIVDNNTLDAVEAIRTVIDAVSFLVPVHFFSFKHGDPLKTHSWSTNTAVHAAITEWVFFTRADYVLDFSAVARFIGVRDAHPPKWNGFITANVYQFTANIEACEATPWRTDGPRVFGAFDGAVADYTNIDAGVWMMQRDAFAAVDGLDETLTAWGHAQTEFQHRLHESGVAFARIPEVLVYHPQHDAPRDIELAHAQLRERGIDIRQLWARHDGVQPYL